MRIEITFPCGYHFVGMTSWVDAVFTHSMTVIGPTVCPIHGTSCLAPEVTNMLLGH